MATDRGVFGGFVVRGICRDLANGLRFSAAASAIPFYALLVLASCAARVPHRPEGPGASDASAEAAFQSAARHCEGLKTLTSEIRLSGRAGEERPRGTLDAGIHPRGTQ